MPRTVRWGVLGLGNIAKKFADNSIIVKSNNTARIQESHIFLGHFILESVERMILKNE